MVIKVLFFLKISKKNSKKDNYGMLLWQLLFIIVFSGIIAYLILFTQQNQLFPIECRGNDNNDGWVKCRPRKHQSRNKINFNVLMIKYTKVGESSKMPENKNQRL